MLENSKAEVHRAVYPEQNAEVLRCHENDCAEGTLDCGSARYRLSDWFQGGRFPAAVQGASRIFRHRGEPKAHGICAQDDTAGDFFISLLEFEMGLTTKRNLAFAVCLFVAVPMAAKKGQKTPAPQPSDYHPVTKYDPGRDPAKDLQDAIREATRSKKRILLEVGGDWCVWCSIMDAAFANHPKLQKLRDNHYVTVKINFSKENSNEKFLSQYPPMEDYPHFFVLDSNGALLHSQGTHAFEHGKSYNAGKIDGFLKKWASPPTPWLTPV